MPTSSPRALTRAPPEFPGLMAASVWMELSTALPPVVRALALTMPAVTVLVRLKGLPMASTHSPSLRSSLLPTVMGCKLSASILMRARSELGSVPMIRALNSRLSLSLTSSSLASATTWLLVTM